MTRRNRQELREEYLGWLEANLRDKYANRKPYWGLVNLMFDTEFRWYIPMDENRMVDGLDLRVEFAYKINVSPQVMKALGPGSFLEVLIGLSRRLAFVAGGQPPGWAWHLFTNLELDRFSDPLTRAKQRKAEEIMRVAMERTYLPDGTGGFFPLVWPDGDQTKIELWYQMHAFIEELHSER
jgi:hypothetical protein